MAPDNTFRSIRTALDINTTPFGWQMPPACPVGNSVAQNEWPPLRGVGMESATARIRAVQLGKIVLDCPPSSSGSEKNFRHPKPPATNDNPERISMFTNRISRYLQQPKPTTRSKPGSTVPKGFAALPNQFTQGADVQGQLYRQAYEQACHQARENLLNLLRSRAKLLD